MIQHRQGRSDIPVIVPVIACVAVIVYIAVGILIAVGSPADPASEPADSAPAAPAPTPTVTELRRLDPFEGLSDEILTLLIGGLCTAMNNGATEADIIASAPDNDLTAAQAQIIVAYCPHARY